MRDLTVTRSAGLHAVNACAAPCAVVAAPDVESSCRAVSGAQDGARTLARSTLELNRGARTLELARGALGLARCSCGAVARHDGRLGPDRRRFHRPAHARPFPSRARAPPFRAAISARATYRTVRAARVRLRSGARLHRAARLSTLARGRFTQPHKANRIRRQCPMSDMLAQS